MKAESRETKPDIQSVNVRWACEQGGRERGVGEGWGGKRDGEEGGAG